ncbi:hypothetical protein D3C85_1853550 [compost metagenome]
MQFDCFRIQLDDFNESVDRLVGLFVEQKIQTLEIAARQSARLGNQLFDIHARSNPAQGKKSGDSEQPPVLKFHAMSYS